MQEEIYEEVEIYDENGTKEVGIVQYVLSKINYCFMVIAGNGWGFLLLLLIVWFFGSQVEHYYISSKILNPQNVNYFSNNDVSNTCNFIGSICICYVMFVPTSLKIFKASGYLQISRLLVLSFFLMCIPNATIYNILQAVAIFLGGIAFISVFTYNRNYKLIQVFSRSTFCMPEEYQEMLQNANKTELRQKNLEQEQKFAAKRQESEVMAHKNDVMKAPPGYKWYRVQGILKGNHGRFDCKTLKKPSDIDVYLKADARFESYHVLGSVCNIDDFNKLPTI